MEMPGVQIGMGATVHCYTDRHGCTVTGIDMVKRIVEVQQDSAKAIGEVQMGHTNFDHKPNPKGAKYTYRWKGGKWEQVRWNPATGRWNQFNCGTRLSLGERHTYFDPHF